MIEEGGGGGRQRASCLIAKQTVEFPQVLASAYKCMYVLVTYTDNTVPRVLSRRTVQGHAGQRVVG